jgi:hypothetical protein
MYESCMHLSANGQLWITFRSYHYTQRKLYVLEVRPEITFLCPCNYLNMRGGLHSDRKSAVPLSEAGHFSQDKSQPINAQCHSGRGPGGGWNYVQRPRMPPKPFHTRDFPTSSAVHYSPYTASQGLFSNFVPYRSL